MAWRPNKQLRGPQTKWLLSLSIKVQATHMAAPALPRTSRFSGHSPTFMFRRKMPSAAQPRHWKLCTIRCAALLIVWLRWSGMPTSAPMRLWPLWRPRSAALSTATQLQCFRRPRKGLSIRLLRLIPTSLRQGLKATHPHR